jgi:hypothetical protein
LLENALKIEIEEDLIAMKEDQEKIIEEDSKIVKVVVINTKGISYILLKA